MIIGKEDTRMMSGAIIRIVFKKDQPNQVDRDLEKLLMVLENSVNHEDKETFIPENLVETFKACYICRLAFGR